MNGDDKLYLFCNMRLPTISNFVSDNSLESEIKNDWGVRTAMIIPLETMY